MIVPPPRRRLALNLLQEHFGDIVEHVASVLLRADDGGYTLRELVQHALVSPPAHLQPRPTTQHIKTALLKLLQHNLLDIKATWLPEDSAKKQKLPYIVRYELNHDEALLRLRFARYIELARELFGDEGEVIMEELLVNGRIRLDQSLDAMARNLADQRRAATGDPDAPAGTSTCALHTILFSNVMLPFLLYFCNIIYLYIFNGVADDDDDELEDLKESLKTTFLNMAKNRYILRVHPLDFNKKKAHDFDDGEAQYEIPSSSSVTSTGGDSTSTTTIKHKKRKGPANAAADSAVPIEVQLMMQAEN
ncbi:hypothetical protein AaE_012247, partial [Aphanomyces astaci]